MDSTSCVGCCWIIRRPMVLASSLKSTGDGASTIDLTGIGSGEAIAAASEEGAVDVSEAVAAAKVLLSRPAEEIEESIL